MVKDRADHLYNIEMQVRRHNAWRAHSAFYLARTLTAH
jgi:hypothetical protein